MTESVGHHRHLNELYDAHRFTYDRVFAFGIVIVLMAIGAVLIRYVVLAVCTFIRNSPMPMW